MAIIYRDTDVFGKPKMTDDGYAVIQINLSELGRAYEGHFPVQVGHLHRTNVPEECSDLVATALINAGIQNVESFPTKKALRHSETACAGIRMPIASLDAFNERRDEFEASVKDLMRNDETIVKGYDDVMNELMKRKPATALSTGSMRILSGSYPIYPVPRIPSANAEVSEYLEAQCGDYHIESFRIAPGIYNEMLESGAFGPDASLKPIPGNDCYISGYDDDGEHWWQEREQVLIIVEGKDGSQWVDLSWYEENYDGPEYDGCLWEGWHPSPENTKPLVDLMHHFKESGVNLGVNSPTAEDKELVRDTIEAFREYDGHSAEVPKDAPVAKQVTGTEVSDGVDVETPVAVRTDDHDGLD